MENAGGSVSPLQLSTFMCQQSARIFSILLVIISCGLVVANLALTGDAASSRAIPHHLRDYCPWCTDASLCKRRFLFVVATGRSGSTTLMGMLDAIPGVFLSGENYNEPAKLQTLLQERMQRVDNSTGHISGELYRSELAAMQEWIWDTNLPAATWLPHGAATSIAGFKEIRWTAEDVAFIQRVCPCSRFVLNTRKDADQQAESGFYVYSTNAVEAVEDANMRIRHAINAVPPDRVFRLQLEEFSIDRFNLLAGWLGFKCRFNRVTHSNARSTYTAGLLAQCR